MNPNPSSSPAVSFSFSLLLRSLQERQEEEELVEERSVMNVVEGGADAMDLDKSERPQETKVGGPSCSICLEFVLGIGERSIAKLQCGHEFHLDCIGSAFNAKGAMQCPNCRKVEKGQWLYANGHRPSPDLDLDGLVTEDVYDLSYSELPLGFQWCPIRGLTQLASLFEEGGPHLRSTHVCPYMALHGFPHPLHSAPSSAGETVPENGSFYMHPSSLGGHISVDMINSHFSATEPQIHSWQQQPPLSFSGSGIPDQSASQQPSRLSRNDTNTHQRIGSLVHSNTFLHGPVTRTGSNVIASLGQPVIGEVRGYIRGHGSQAYRPSAPSSSLRASAFAPVRRPRPRALAVFSSTIASSSVDIGGFYGLSVSGYMNRNHQDGENIGRSFERAYGWGREGESAPLPWIPAEGESQWWGPFHPNQNPLSLSADSTARSFLPQRAAGERVGQSHPENVYHHMPLPRMLPYM